MPGSGADCLMLAEAKLGVKWGVCFFASKADKLGLTNRACSHIILLTYMKGR